MPLQNRVTPLGELVAVPERGLVYGNRGCLHDADMRIRRQFQVKRWISCRLEFRGRYRGVMPPGRYTALFFLDEATAFAAGHRPCAECRRHDYNRFVKLWGTGERADAIDARLHDERMRRTHDAHFDELPDGAFVLEDGEPWLVLGNELLRWTPGGYADRHPRPHGAATLVTPPSSVAVLRHGWSGVVPFLHPSISGAGPWPMVGQPPGDRPASTVGARARAS